ncbi:MAG: hypothetical protein HYX24_01505 [Candidatus Aenigmarchaeota archaeon]|nr:hypothetical protein [Candidatus Aenigmarchaeota archaeon]
MPADRDEEIEQFLGEFKKRYGQSFSSETEIDTKMREFAREWKARKK